MIRRSLFLFLLSVSAGSFQAQTPEQPRTGTDSRVFSMFFDADGGYLGIETHDITRENFGRYGLKDVKGVAVERVAENSPAAAAGLQAGDVLIRFNGDEITSVRKLTRLVGEVAPDHQVRLTVIRGGAEREITATLGKRPSPRFESGAFAWGAPGQAGRVRIPPLPIEPPDVPVFPQQAPDMPFEPFSWRTGSSRQIGVGVTPLTKQLAGHFGVSGGVLVNNVSEGSPAARAGLKAGDIITEIDGREVKGDFDLIRAIAEKKEGDLSLTIVRDRNRQTVRVTPEEVKGSPNGFFDSPESGRFKLTVPAAPLRPNEMLFPSRVL